MPINGIGRNLFPEWQPGSKVTAAAAGPRQQKGDFPDEGLRFGNHPAPALFNCHTIFICKAKILQMDTPTDVIGPPSGLEVAGSVHAQLSELRQQIANDAETILALWRPSMKRADFLPSAINLANYLAFRKADIRPLQSELSVLGLSSLGRCEAQVLASFDAVLASLALIAGITDHPYPSRSVFLEGKSLLNERQAAIFGRDPGGPQTRIMVTLPTEAATDPALIKRLITEGADCMRINCAHDNADIWAKMIAIARQAATELMRDVRIAMDLGGPKVRIEKVSTDKKIRLLRGDDFVLTDVISKKTGPIEATLSYPELLDRLSTGAEVWINDGKIGARVTEKTGRRVTLNVFSAREKGERLKPEKGVNFPGVEVNIPALTNEDIANLDFVAAHADIVGYSFVQTPEDVRGLVRELSARCTARPVPALMLKIETPLAVRNLPRLIVQAGGLMPVAVMIARGDLAVEIGLERLSEMQEEILWLCEAAHVPVVWATQVLDSLVKDGTASRAETTDAAMAQRAECVMLNKGPHLVDAVAFLDRILRRMDRHQSKKSAQLGPLQSWQDSQTLV
jgi:pyruvate kinase